MNNPEDVVTFTDVNSYQQRKLRAGQTPGFKRVAVLGLAALLLLLVFMACAGVSAPLQLVGKLVFGWLDFLKRVLPQLHFAMGGLLTALVCLAGLTAGLHGFASWFCAKQSPEIAIPWQRSWTIGIVGLVVLLFVSGIAAVGLTHQTIWLATDPQPFLGSSGGAYTTFQTMGEDVDAVE